MAAWLAGNGCVPLYNLMEDAATAEISRAQIWQWLHQPNGVLVRRAEGHGRIGPRVVPRRRWTTCKQTVGAERFARGNYDQARKLIERIVFKDEFTEFMTLVGYEHLD